MLGYSAGPMTDRDLLEPVDPAGPRRRRPGARALGSVSDALARLVPRPRGDDGSYDAGTGIAMSDEELREAFRLASLTVTPAPLGRPSRREDSPPPDGESGDSGPDVSSPLRTPTVARTTADAATAPVRPAGAAVSPAGPARPAGPAAMSAALEAMSVEPAGMSVEPANGSTAVPEASTIGVPAPVPESAPESVPTSLAAATPLLPAPANGQGSGLDPAPDASRPIGDLPDPTSAGQVQLPGNLGFSGDDFFGGLVRRIERRP